MKFLCDRCKTRYSIGDERVRGKILKIRCKHCANVITVREGMQVEEGSVVGPLPGAPRTKTSTIAPEALDERNASSGLLNVASLSPAPSVAAARRSAVAAESALGAAVVSATMPAAKPPPAALEEEWYVSIDGEQSGPFSLADAQRWVTAKPFEADLHCWSEGFDDWLPVDKVSHFRGLRKRPVPPPAPPPPAMPVVPRTISPRASVAKTPTPVPSELPARANASPAFGTAVAPRTNGAARAPTDDLFDAPGKTQLEPSPLDAPAPAPAVTAPADDGFTGDGDLDFGEVSRVVNLADLARQAKPRRPATSATGAQPALRTTGSHAAFRGTGAQPALRTTGSHAAFRGTGAQSILPGPIAAPVEPLAPADAIGPAPVAFPPSLDAPAPGPADATPPVATAHRRGLFVLLGVAGLLLIGVVIALVALVSPSSETGGTLGKIDNIDTSRPDDPVTHRPTVPPSTGSGSAVTVAPPTVPHPPVRRPTPPPPTNHEPETPGADALRSDEIEDVARKHQDTTQRCYMRSQRGADAILVGDVKKIAVTLLIEKDGSVTDVQLSDHAADTLGKCLATSIRGWKFRSSSGGRFRFSLNFVSS